MNPSKIDVPVLLIFFARPHTFEKVFASVKEARPSVLLLWQDGPRPGNRNDVEGIEACRKIVEEGIDWDCTVYKTYNETNYGCDPSTFFSHKWAFSLVDKCIVLEDDMVPSQSYFRFCKEMLDKYESDERINHVCGVNPVGVNEHCPSDYFFAYNGTGAWASWRRVARGWDEEYTFLDKKYYIDNLRYSRGSLFEKSLRIARGRRRIGKPYWETILGFNCMMNSRLVILPKVNLVKHIGVTAGATHGSDLRLMYKSIRNVFLQEAHEIEFPLREPEYVVPDERYVEKYNRIMGIGHPFLTLCRRTGYVFRCIRYGKFGNIVSAIRRRLG